MKRRWIILTSPALLLAGWWIYAQTRNPEADAPPPPSPPAVGKMEPENRLIETGILEADVLATIPSPSRGVIAELAEDGSRVQAGALLARMDAEEIQNNIEDDLVRLEQDQEDLDSERHELTVLMNQYASVARLEKAELAFAELKLSKADQPLTPGEIRLHEIDIELAELDVEEARSKRKRQRKLVNRNFAPPSSLEALERQLDSAETYLQEKRTRFELARAPMPKEERLTLESEVRKARETVRRSQAMHEQELAIQELKLEGLRLKIRNREDRLAERREKLKSLSVRAPVGGIFLLSRDYSWGSSQWEPLSVGNRIWDNDLIGTIVDPDNLQLRIMIHESDVLHVRPGQPAGIQLTAFPDQTFQATVRTVTELGQDRDDLSPLHRQAPPANQALFLAILDVDLPKDLGAMPGMTATVSLRAEENP